jgi:hypothetical protein
VHPLLHATSIAKAFCPCVEYPFDKTAIAHLQ